jgi:hypothetical protein
MMDYKQDGQVPTIFPFKETRENLARDKVARI